MIYEMLSGINPFKVRNKNKFEKLQMILEDEIEMQPGFSDDACSLIQGLLEKKVPSSLNIVCSRRNALATAVLRRSRTTHSSAQSTGPNWRRGRLTLLSGPD